jgi:hypothetical protein
MRRGLKTPTFYFKDINTGVFCGTGRAFKSTDGGENWFDTNVPVLAYHVFMKLGRNGNNLWLAGMAGRLFSGALISVTLGTTLLREDK